MIRRNGFTLPELIIVIGILSVLFSFSSILLLQVQYKASLSSTAALLSADINSQRLRAMQGNTFGAASAGPHGIYFATDGYTLFHGSTYSPLDASNYTVRLEYPLSFTQITLPGSALIFSPGGGDLVGYNPVGNLVVLSDVQSQESVTYSFNRYGIPATP